MKHPLFFETFDLINLLTKLELYSVNDCTVLSSRSCPISIAGNWTDAPLLHVIQHPCTPYMLLLRTAHQQLPSKTNTDRQVVFDRQVADLGVKEVMLN